ncbi:hypothetical protein GE09DRAFT_732991 [Coniochaeta sp. 2T2.1]|nr:hypothetical protein GE09DRAFT_732991 [Coniochaeta sp. 2T2.1]
MLPTSASQHTTWDSDSGNFSCHSSPPTSPQDSNQCLRKPCHASVVMSAPALSRFSMPLRLGERAVGGSALRLLGILKYTTSADKSIIPQVPLRNSMRTGLTIALPALQTISLPILQTRLRVLIASQSFWKLPLLSGLTPRLFGFQKFHGSLRSGASESMQVTEAMCIVGFGRNSVGIRRKLSEGCLLAGLPTQKVPLSLSPPANGRRSYHHWQSWRLVDRPWWTMCSTRREVSGS